MLLRDEIYLGYINGIEQYKTLYANEEDKSLVLDIIKCELRRATLVYTKTQSRLNKEY